MYWNMHPKLADPRRKNSLLLIVFLLVNAVPALADPAPILFRTKDATFGLDATGSLSQVSRNFDSRKYLAEGQPAPLLSVRVGGQWHRPRTSAWDAQSQRLTLRFDEAGITGVVAVDSKPTHVTFELVELQPLQPIELIVWGPYPTTISNTIGEVIGVVRDPEFAIGIQALNARTLGGFPERENDIEPDYGADDSASDADFPAELKKDQLFRGDTARRTPFGSVLQAYCRQRDRNRTIANWGHEKFLAPAYRDGGVIGSKIALFACPAQEALQTIGTIELAEGLPHPLLDGVWAKIATNANCSYLIVDFSENTIDLAVEMARRAGLTYLYHSSPFETWGHFKLKPSLFPHGWDGLRDCVEKARKAGVRIGFHTLSNFITPNDPFVTPRPDPRLAVIGTSQLATDVGAAEKEITLFSADFFRKKTALNTVRIGDELIRYAAVSTEAPWRLLDCQRGAWGTAATAHTAGATIAKLMDHDYNVFLTDADLTQEVARNIAKLCNHAGTLQISLDGLEGNWSTGLGQYGRTLFTKAWFDALSPELRGQINDASNPGHFNWHIYTRMNWGEPWYAGFRESQTLYRFKNQLHFERNLMPPMLGWFALRQDTSLEDAEWLLARAAGFNAGFALATGLASTAQLQADPESAQAAQQYGAMPAILNAIHQWETARLAGAFPPQVRAQLRDNTREFHLRAAGPEAWDLFEVQSERFTLDPNQATAMEHSFNQINARQALQWIIRSTGKQPTSGLVVEINGQPTFQLGDQTLPPGGSLKYNGGPTAVVCDSSWKELVRLPVQANAVEVGPGIQQVKIRSAENKEASLKVELRTFGPALRVGVRTEAR